MKEDRIKEVLSKHRWWFNYANFYNYIASIKTFTKFIEVGVWQGTSISYLANLLRERENLELYAVDLFKNSPVREAVPTQVTENEVNNLYEIYNYNLEQTNTRCLIKDIDGCSWEVAKKFEDNYFDFIFIDAGHKFVEASKDINNWYPKLKKNGIIAGHDWEMASIRKTVYSFLNKKDIKVLVFIVVPQSAPEGVNDAIIM